MLLLIIENNVSFLSHINFYRINFTTSVIRSSINFVSADSLVFKVFRSLSKIAPILSDEKKKKRKKT